MCRPIVFFSSIDEEPLALRDVAQSQPIIISAPALVSPHSVGVQSLGAQSRGFRFRCRCRCRDGKSASRSAQLHDFHAAFLLSSGNIVFPAMSRERETTRVRKFLTAIKNTSAHSLCALPLHCHLQLPPKPKGTPGLRMRPAVTPHHPFLLG